MKSVLLYINEDGGLDARLQAALDLTRAVDGYLHCLHINPYHSPVAFDGMTGMSLMYDVAKMTREADLQLRQKVEKRLADEDVSWIYEEADADNARGLAKNSALADIIVMSSASGNKDNNLPIGTLGDVLFNARVPMLVQPSGMNKFDATGCALIAWNGSFEAGNALRAAVPLLKLASDVHILTVTEDKDHDLPPLDASEYLSRHEIKSEVHELAGKKSSVRDVLIANVDALGVSYIVMGAYGHSRAREFIFGGVTRSLFRDSPVPLVVSH